MTRFRTAAIAASAVAAGAAIAFASPAHASVNAGTVYTSNEAGWQAHGNGWNFRYLQDDVTLPDVTSSTFQGSFAGYGASLRLANGSQIVDVGISTATSGGPYNAAFAVEYPDHSLGCSNTASPAIPAGDTVRMTLFYDYTGSGNIRYSVSDTTQAGHNFSGTCHDPDQFFGAAQVVAGFSADDWTPATVHPVSGNHRLIQFRDTVVTSRTGIRSSIGTGSGHWPTQKIALTSDGTPTGTLLASVPYAWGKFAVSPDNVIRDGRNITVWMPKAP